MSQDYEAIKQQWQDMIEGKHGYDKVNGNAHYPTQFFDDMGQAIPVGSDEYKKRLEQYKQKRGLI